ncbi:hypothetical protein [Polynucleobacter sp.]|uniref:hypothetical protein n=1 Tax=Polynucleobacter sp. TaxID=2029855 RepID=UPI003340843F
MHTIRRTLFLFAQLGPESMPGTPNQFASMVARERARWSTLIKQAEINPNEDQ